MYIIQLDNGRTILTDATNKMQACNHFITMSKAGEEVARILKYSGTCDNPKVTIIFSIIED